MIRFPRAGTTRTSAASLLSKLEQQVSLSESQYTFLLQHCATSSDLVQGQRVHEHLIANGYAGNAKLGDLLIRMYGSCGKLDTARSIFDSLKKRSKFAWRFMIAAYAQKGHSTEVLELYQRMNAQGEFEADQHLFARVLGACASLNDAGRGEDVHAEIVSRNLEAEMLVATALVNMYGKCRRLDKARKLFDGIQGKDVVCWNAMIAAYARSDSPEQALDASVLAACSELKAFEEGQLIHSQLQLSKFGSVISVQNALISMYASCKHLELAKSVFDKLERKNTVTWNALLASYAQHGESRSALKLFAEMNVQPDAVTFTAVLRACSQLGLLAQGKAVHARIMSIDGGVMLKNDEVLQVALVNMYAKCGDLECAKAVFEGMNKTNVVAWNVMIVGYTQQGYSMEALQLFKRLEFEGLMLLEEGEKIYASYVASREHRGNVLEQVSVQNAVVNLYAKCGKLETARNVFEKTENKNVVSWTAMIGGYVQQEEYLEAVSLYRRMKLEGVQPNEVTLAAVLGACSHSKELMFREGVEIHSLVSAGWLSSAPVLDTAIINMYGSCGKLDLARRLFDAKGDEASVASWNAIIGAYAQAGHTQEAIELYRRMMDSKNVQANDITFCSVLSVCSDLEAGKEIHQSVRSSSPVVQTALLNMYGKCGCLELARSIFEGIEHKDVVSWNAMIAAYALQGEAAISVEVYDRMISEGVEPDSSTFVTVLGACSNLGALKSGEKIHSRITRSVYKHSPAVAAALINMYAKCGRVDLARRTFDSSIFCSGNGSVVAWNTMIAAYAHHGHGAEGVKLCQQMMSQGVELNEISLASALVACSHAGLSEAGRMIFINMLDDHQVVPSVDHYICMVDILARGGKLQDAEDLILNMPFQPYPAAWTSLLGGCRNHGDVARGERVAAQVLKLDPDNTVPYNLLTDLF